PRACQGDARYRDPVKSRTTHLRPQTFYPCWVALLSSLAVLTSVNCAAAEPLSFARWSNESALTTAEDRVELGMTSDSSWAVSKRVELRTHPLVSLIAPRLSGKVRWLDHGP